MSAPANKSKFFYDAEAQLTDRNNSLFSLNDISTLYKIDFGPLKLAELWAVIVKKNGIESTLIISKDTKDEYTLINYGEPPSSFYPSFNSSKNGTSPSDGKGNTSANSGSQTSSNSGSTSSNSGSQSANSVSVPTPAAPSPTPASNSGASVANSSQTPPTANSNSSTNAILPTPKGNGNLTSDSLKSLYSGLMTKVKDNSKGSCTAISAIDYYVDPPSKIIAFMLSCA